MEYLHEAYDLVMDHKISCIFLSAGLLLSILVAVAVAPKPDGEKRSFKSVFTSMCILCNPLSVLKKDQVKNSFKEYYNLFSGARDDVGEITSDESIKKRQDKYQTMIVNFYDLVTDFYEWGWGQSFHFGPRFKDESFIESIKRAEYHLASRLNMKKGAKAIDLGCGVGGPMRNIAKFSGGSIEGVTINEYQVRVGNKYNALNGLEGRCRSRQGDFQNLGEFEDNTFDAAYAIEATCHSPDKVTVFKEALRVLRPGGRFAGYEWIVTNNYDANDKDHVRIKEGIEVGNGLPTLATAEEVLGCLKEAGFNIVEAFDANEGVHDPHQVPWYATLKGSFSLSGFRMTYLGRCCTHAMVNVLELLRIAPPGSSNVSAMLNATALDLVEGGEKEIFTPSYYFLAEKPMA